MNNRNSHSTTSSEYNRYVHKLFFDQKHRGGNQFLMRCRTTETTALLRPCNVHDGFSDANVKQLMRN